MSSSGRVPPHNLDAEQSLLGSMFLSQDAADEALGKLRHEDFYRPAHGRIFEAMGHLNGRGQHVDHITVADRLEATGQLEASGGREYLLEITRVVPTSANAELYGEIVKRTSILRQLIAAATEIVSLGFEAPDDLDAVVVDAEKRIFDVTNQRVQSNFRDIKELLEAGFKQIEALGDKPEHVTGVATRFVDLDHLLAGFHAGDLVILAARPSVGKTALALNMAVGAAKSRARVGIFSLEMSCEQLIQRVLCAEARVDSHKLRVGALSDDDWHKVAQAAGELNGLDMYVDDTPAISILELRAKARRLLRGAEQGLVIVDYLQLMQPQNRRSENRQTEIADISRGLKILAKELGVPVLALSQLSRAVEARPDKRPLLSDLRESGAIEQDADVVMFIHRDTRPPLGDDTEDDSRRHFPEKGMAELIVAKHRNGPTGVVHLTFNSNFTRFGDATTKNR
ncbi:MAG: replicative DNA helicase [Coriobacteriia bacterium]|nr:replicative DNA helicase [Coriobacteriia bacterium]